MITINGNPITVNGNFINDVVIDPLPPFTIRLKFADNYIPTFSRGTGVQVSTSPNIWDLTYENSNWYSLLKGQSQIIEVIGGNTTGVTNMSEMFSQNFVGARLTTISLLETSNVTDMGSMFQLCDSLVNIPLLNTSNVTNMAGMFAGCNSLTSIPLFDTSKVTNMNSTFGFCHYVQSGALALYKQASTQANPPTNHVRTFGNCGDLTQTGAAELAQIPDDWK
jgi:surface protein